MTITTKYNIGDMVYFIEYMENEIVTCSQCKHNKTIYRFSVLKGEVTDIKISVDSDGTSIRYDLSMERQRESFRYGIMEKRLYNYEVECKLECEKLNARELQ